MEMLLLTLTKLIEVVVPSMSNKIIGTFFSTLEEDISLGNFHALVSPS